LQSFPENYKMHNQIDDKGNDFFSYKQFGNSLNLEVVKIVEKELLSKY
jgi:DNA (cytosine-5)-methyltransferase 1